MRSYAEESAAAGRQILPDLARAWALFGIALVNVGVLAWPMMSGYHFDNAGKTGITGPQDFTAYFLVNALFLLKSYSLFSFMFGVGFGHQMESAERRGVGFAGRYWRRILGLFAFGALNITLLFFGDILVVYALLGSLLFLFRKSSPKKLIGWGIGVYVVQILIISAVAGLIALGAAFAPDEMAEGFAEMGAMDTQGLAAFGSGGLATASAFRIENYISGLPFILLMQGPGAFAFFLFGLAAVKTGAIADPSAPVWKRARRAALPIGLLVSGAGAWLLTSASGMSDPDMFFGMALITLGSPFSTFGYLGLIAKWAEGKGGPVRTFLARGGTSSLTAYLMQGLLFSLIFSAYGLGYFAELPAAVCIGIAAGVALFTIAFASLWRTAFKQGPTEFILRKWTYLGER